MRPLSGSSFVACSYFEMAPSMFDDFAWSPSLARLTASMLFRLHAAIAIAAAATSPLLRRSGALMTAAVYGNRSRQVYCGLIPRGEHDRIDDRDHAAFGLREREVAE